ncbi:hypothetical protein [Rhodopirellula sp. SWK7]|uniref:hypothetical protein n=1 Tax=Rhodopirellula sp. SWK7 TaxID=595460 RepID=UPI001181B141|nr:hypothetical protein [Rhodopirellula sp. SWK7]
MPKPHPMPPMTATADGEWVRGDEVRRRLKLTTCELAHLRESGALPFQKNGNAFLYHLNDAGPDRS